MIYRADRASSALLPTILALCLVGGGGQVRAADNTGPWRLKTKIVVDEQAWNWNWAAWDQEKIATFGQHQYTVYWDADKVMVLVRRDLRTNRFQALRLPKFTLRNSDTHRNTCLGVSAADGRLHLSWDHHNNPLRYTKSCARFLTAPPETMRVSDLEPAQPMLADRTLENRVTYPRFVMDRRGALFCIYRTGSSGNGDHYLQRYDPKTGTWVRVGMILSRRGTYGPWKDSTSRCAYPHDFVFDKRNRLHLSWVYRETGGTWASNHDLHYAYSDDGGLTWYNNAAEKIADLAKSDPIELSDRGIVVRKIPVFSWVINTGCMALDSRNRPHVITYKLPDIHKPEKLKHSPPDHIRKQHVFVHYWRGDDGTWRGGEPIDPGGTITKRPDVVFDGTDTLYFYYTTPKGIRCMHAASAGEWRKWSSYSLTGPDLTTNDASKHDRARWREDGILSFTARTNAKTPGFAILDFVLSRRP